MIELDPRTREMLAELRELGRTYMRPMGLESDRTGAPPPADHPFYLICSRQGGLVSRVVGEGEPSEGRPERGRQAARAARSEPQANEAQLDWKPLRALLIAEESAYWDRGVALSLPGPGLGGAALRSMATPSSASVFSRRSRITRARTGAPWP
ncbi:MAG TPA: hypothetical protein VMR86_16255 [Myxococcota bacterium]|nr:hypothetical protein [Myxococcota bacterium]